MVNSMCISFPFSAGQCFKYLKSRFCEKGMVIAVENDLFHQMRVSISPAWFCLGASFDIKVLGRMDSSDVYITQRCLISSKWALIEDLAKRRLDTLLEAINADV